MCGCTDRPGALLPVWASVAAGRRARGAARRAAATNGAFFMVRVTALKWRRGPARALRALFAFRRKAFRRRRHEQGQARQQPDTAPPAPPAGQERKRVRRGKRVTGSGEQEGGG